MIMGFEIKVITPFSSEQNTYMLPKKYYEIANYAFQSISEDKLFSGNTIPLMVIDDQAVEYYELTILYTNDDAVIWLLSLKTSDTKNKCESTLIYDRHRRRNLLLRNVKHVKDQDSPLKKFRLEADKYLNRAIEEWEQAMAWTGRIWDW